MRCKTGISVISYSRNKLFVISDNSFFIRGDSFKTNYHELETNIRESRIWG